MAFQPKSSERAAPAAASPRKRSKRAPGSRLTQAQVDEIFARFARADPDPKTELDYRDPFTLIVAVVLSAQATDSSVNHATPALFRIADTPEKLAKLGEATLTEKIKTIGLYRSKAKNLIALSKKLIAEHDGKVPATREALEALPGVGRKTANVVLNVAFGQPTIGIDTHAFRVGNRTGLAPGKTPLAVELTLNRIVPERYKPFAHHWLILHGRYVCKARKPECWRCLIADICLYKPKTPEPGTRP
ncbi:endonuclease III [Methyloceanibacter sp.]|uniref:endonuclease III n=1 Tax=Methyloceanibacter sp. TaxID=1965321 RepID=UPI00351AEB3D